MEITYVTAPYGKKLYKARISETSEDKLVLTKKETKDGQFPLQFTFKEEMLETQRLPCVNRTELGQELAVSDYVRQTAPRTLEKHNAHKETIASGSSSSDKSTPEMLTPTRVPTVPDKLTPEMQTPTVPDESTPEMLTPAVPDKSTPEMLTPTVPDKSTPEMLAPTVPFISSPSSKRKLDQLEKDLKELRGSYKALKKRVKELEEVQSKENTPNFSGSILGNVEDINQYDSLMNMVSHLSGTSEKDPNNILRILCIKVFSCEELITCTRTGKKTSKTGDAPKPRLDDIRLQLLERVVLTKCPSMNTEIFKKKFDNILKMERRAAAVKPQV